MEPVAVEESNCNNLALIPALHPPACDNLSEIARPSCAPKPHKATGFFAPPFSLHPLLLSRPVCFLHPLHPHPLAWLQNTLAITHMPHLRLRQNPLALARHQILLATTRPRSAKLSSSSAPVLAPPSKQKCEGPSTPCYQVHDHVCVVTPRRQAAPASVSPYAKASTTLSSPGLPMQQILSHRSHSRLLCHSCFAHIGFCPLSRVPQAATRELIPSNACTSHGNVPVIRKEAKPLPSPARAMCDHLDLVRQFARPEVTEDGSDLSEGEKMSQETGQATGEVAKLRQCEDANWAACYLALCEPHQRSCEVSAGRLSASAEHWRIRFQLGLHLRRQAWRQHHSFEPSRRTCSTTPSFLRIQLPLFPLSTFPRKLPVKQPVSSSTYDGSCAKRSGNSQDCSHSHRSFPARRVVAAPTEDSRDFSEGEMMRMVPA